jgi:hypothetical protein
VAKRTRKPNPKQKPTPAIPPPATNADFHAPHRSSLESLNILRSILGAHADDPVLVEEYRALAVEVSR